MASGLVYLQLKNDIINPISEKNKENIKITNSPHADWIDYYENFDSLIKDADIVIQGKKIDSYAEQRVDLIFTKEVIEINKVYQGDVNIGDKIEILQTGGILNGIETEPFSEAPLLEDDGQYLLLLQYTKEGHYLILGGYQGIGLIEDNQVKFNSENIIISNDLIGKDINSIEKSIEKLIENE